MPVKSTPKSAYVRNKIAKTGCNRQKCRVLYAEKCTSLKKYTTAGCVVVTNISYAYGHLLTPVIHEIWPKIATQDLSQVVHLRLYKVRLHVLP